MNNQPERTLVSFDWALKHILRDKANYDVLEGFLNALLGREVKILRLLESETNQQYESDKFNRVDMLVEDTDGQLLIIEIQNSRERHYLQRLLYGTSKLLIEHLNLGDDYDKVRKVISISILYFLLGKGSTDYIYHGRTEFYGLNDHSRLNLADLERWAVVGRPVQSDGNIFPEYYLIEVERFHDLIAKPIDEWVYFFKHSEVKDEFQAKNIRLLQEKLNLMRMTQLQRQAYENYVMNRVIEKDVFETAHLEGIEVGRIQGIEEGRTQGIEEGRTQGIEEGRTQGIEEGRTQGREEGRTQGQLLEKIAIAQKLLVGGFAVADVVAITGLSQSDIQKLISH